MKKRKIRIVAAVLFLFLSASGIYAYFSDTESKQNTLSIGADTTEIAEEFDPPEEIAPGTVFVKKPSVKNTGSVPCYVRVLCEFSDSMYEDLFSLDFNTDDWTGKQDDGYYYYKRILNPGSTTEPLFTTVTYSGGQDFDSEFEIIVCEESVQSENYSNYKDAFDSIS